MNLGQPLHRNFQFGEWSY